MGGSTKRNLLNVGKALADKVHKQGEHIPQHCYISHNHPYISSSDTLGGTISISTQKPAQGRPSDA